MNSHVETASTTNPAPISDNWGNQMLGKEKKEGMQEQNLPISDRVIWGGKGSYAESLYLVPCKTKSYGPGSNITSDIEKVLLNLSLKGIEIPKPTEVREYLINNNDMTGLLMNFGRRAYERFAFGSQVSLEVYHDPEIDDEHLVLYIRKDIYNSNIMEEIENISKEFDGDLISKSGWFIMTTDFRPPR